MKSQFGTFLKKLTVFLLIVFVVDFSLGKVLEHFYQEIDIPTPEQHTTFSIEHADTDIMVFGSSRAQHHYDPESFDDLPNTSFYNTGKDGQGIFYSWAVLKSVLHRKKDSGILILDLNINEFDKSQDSYDRLSELLPHYTEHEEIQDIVNLKSPFEEIKAISYLYRYNSKVLTIIKDNLFPKKDNMEKGYEPIPVVRRNLQLTVFEDAEAIDSLEVAAFVGFLKDAKAADQKVYVFVSPSYRQYLEEPQTIRIARDICRELNVPFISFHQDSLFLRNANYFDDPTHLNEAGAEIYSDKVLNIIKKEKILNSSS